MIKSRKVGASGRAFSARATGFKLNASVAEHGYKYKLQVDIDFAALTDRQAQKVHKDIYDALTQSLTNAAEMRAVNVPLFDLEDIITKTPAGEGINTR